MSKIIVFIYDDMADFEITFACHLLGADIGKELVTVAYEDKIIKSRSGIDYKPQKLIKDMIEEDIEGLILPGGWNGEIRQELLELISRVHAEGKLLAAICAGPRFLAKAGILSNIKYTTSIVEWTESYRDLFKEEDPFPRENFVFERVVREKNVITAQGVAFVDFAIEICDWFNVFGNEDERKAFETQIKGI